MVFLTIGFSWIPIDLQRPPGRPFLLDFVYAVCRVTHYYDRAVLNDGMSTDQPTDRASRSRSQEWSSAGPKPFGREAVSALTERNPERL